MSSYREWLVHAAELVDAGVPVAEEYDAERAHFVLAAILNDVFEEAHDWDFNDEAAAVKELNELLGREAPDTEGLSAAEMWDLVLEAAMLLTVSEVSMQRKKYIQQILSMEEGTQAHMKEAIETYMQERLSSPRKPVRQSTVGSEEKSFLQDDEESVASPTKSDMACRACHSCEELQRHLDEARKREHILQETIERNAYKHLHQTLNSDIDMMDSQSQLERQQAEIAALKAHLKKHEADKAKYENLELDMQMLRDEVDVLRPAAKQVEALEDQISRYRDRMEEMTQTKHQLQQEQEAHAKAIDQVLELQTQLEPFSRTSSQLAEYRQRCTDQEMQLRELSHRLKAANDTIMQLTDSNSHLQGNGAEMKNMAATLEAQLRFAEQEFQAISAGEAIGAGISELNPALMEEVTRLRHENEQLLLKVDGNRAERIAELEDEVDDLRRLGDGFQAKYLQTKAQLETTLAKLAQTQDELATTQQNRDELIQRCEEITAKAASDITDMRAAHDAHVAHLLETAKHKLTLTTSALGVLVTRLTDDFTECAHIRDEEATAHQKYLAAFTAASSELHSLRQTYEHDTATLRQVAADAETKFTADMAEFKSDISKSMDEKDSAIAVGSEKVRSLEVDLAEAMRQCRKLEREKKNLQAECDRARADMITAENSNSRGSNYAEFSREYQTLLQELAHYKQLATNASAGAPTVPGVPVIGSAVVDGGVAAPTTRARTAASRDEPTASGTRSGPQRVLRGALRAQSASANTEYSETIQQYEFRLEKLTQEKRELVMKTSLAFSEKQELERVRAHHETRIRDLEHTITRLQLQVERASRHLEKNGLPPLPAAVSNKENTSNMSR